MFLFGEVGDCGGFLEEVFLEFGVFVLELAGLLRVEDALLPQGLNDLFLVLLGLAAFPQLLLAPGEFYLGLGVFGGGGVGVVFIDFEFELGLEGFDFGDIVHHAFQGFANLRYIIGKGEVLIIILILWLLVFLFLDVLCDLVLVIPCEFLYELEIFFDLF